MTEETPEAQPQKTQMTAQLVTFERDGVVVPCHRIDQNGEVKWNFSMQQIIAVNNLGQADMQVSDFIVTEEQREEKAELIIDAVLDAKTSIEAVRQIVAEKMSSVMALGQPELPEAP